MRFAVKHAVASAVVTAGIVAFIAADWLVGPGAAWSKRVGSGETPRGGLA